MKIGEKEYSMKCSLGTMMTFENVFGINYAETVTSIQKIFRKARELEGEDQQYYMFEAKAKTIVDITKLAYVMIKEANPEFTEPYEVWIKTLGNLPTQTYMEILTMAQSIFQG